MTNIENESKKRGRVSPRPNHYSSSSLKITGIAGKYNGNFIKN